MGEIFCLPCIFYPTPNSIVFWNKLTLSLKFNQNYITPWARPGSGSLKILRSNLVTKYEMIDCTRKSCQNIVKAISNFLGKSFILRTLQLSEKKYVNLFRRVKPPFSPSPPLI